MITDRLRSVLITTIVDPISDSLRKFQLKQRLTRGWQNESTVVPIKVEYEVKEVKKVSIPIDDLNLWYHLVRGANGIETVWGLLAFVNENGEVSIAKSLVPSAHDHWSFELQTTHIGNRRLQEMNNWYVSAWKLQQEKDPSLKKVHLGFVGFGHNHPPSIFHHLSNGDLNTIKSNLTIGMPVFIAPLCMLKPSMVLKPDVNGTPNLMSLVAEEKFDVKIFAATRNNLSTNPFTDSNPKMVDFEAVKACPYNLPPLSWHVANHEAFNSTVELLKRAGCAVNWTLKTDSGRPLPYLNLLIQNKNWTKDVIIKTDWDFPNSAPQIILIENDEDNWGQQTEVKAIDFWDGTSNFDRIIAQMLEKGLLREPETVQN